MRWEFLSSVLEIRLAHSNDVSVNVLYNMNSINATILDAILHLWPE